MNRIEEAMLYASQMHARQTRSTLLSIGDRSEPISEPYFNHCLRVWFRTKVLNVSEDVQVASLLHDVVEDTNATLDDIKEKFGNNVADIVGHLTLPPTLVRGDHMAKRYIQTQAMITASDDARIIKIFDKLDNNLSSVTSGWALHTRIGYLLSSNHVVEAAKASTTNEKVHDAISVYYSECNPYAFGEEFKTAFFNARKSDASKWGYWLRSRNEI